MLMMMSDQLAAKQIEIEIVDHPALVAWRSVCSNGLKVSLVETLQEERKASLYRLRGTGPTPTNVIAKLCYRHQSSKERAIYEEILPRLPFPTLQIYGFVEAADDLAWLFIEDAGVTPYLPSLPQHRSLAAAWLAVMHTSASELGAASSLDDRGCDYFAVHLETAANVIRENLSNRSFSAAEVQLLKSILSQCEVVISRWRELEDFCRGMPQTLVHGDFKEDNMCVRKRFNKSVLMPFDWNEAGWGVPALDLAKFLGYSVQPDVDTYRSIVRRRWPFLDLQTILRIGWVGEVFRCTTSIRWEAELLCYEWLEATMSKMRVYKDWLDEIVQAAPWTNGPTRPPKPRGWH